MTTRQLLLFSFLLCCITQVLVVAASYVEKDGTYLSCMSDTADIPDGDAEDHTLSLENDLEIDDWRVIDTVPMVVDSHHSRNAFDYHVLALEESLECKLPPPELTFQ